MEFEENNRQFAEEVTADNQYEKLVKSKNFQKKKKTFPTEKRFGFIFINRLRSMVLPFSNLDYQEQLKVISIRRKFILIFGRKTFYLKSWKKN